MLKRVMLVHEDSNQIAGYTLVSGPKEASYEAWVDLVQRHLYDLGFNLLNINPAWVWRERSPGIPENVVYVVDFEIIGIDVTLEEVRGARGPKEWLPPPANPSSWLPQGWRR